ncbi:S49 family peptidase [Actinoalloteichus hymeniacidonis]|uniref:ClpP class periplasmic serine protease n=1 Tax=Actinoalloteichus hymeniacidonis TaxID=340345 RepID=A0AAC9MWC3_9PSEU|nr:S49 family peptidase [Actinoalloteichus hymeniacidonis]AOS60929.1 ClpP class periplasmic serine protease [Actinoalloteichus hymeniacidonis]MBB5911071.1 signal peptide peptidase SppA [Actinoalloteichus hymeniacidonis]
MSVTDKLAARLPLPGRLGERGDRAPVVGVVRLHGVITANPGPGTRGALNLHSVETALTRAFSHERLAAVALVINSPGGSPTQSALIADRIMGLAEEKSRRGRKIPVIAFCEDVAASGGYWLACAADEIYAHPTSMVGSIGVISSGFGLTGLLERFGVERRIHTAGTNKVRLDPFSPEKDEDVAWLKNLQTELHEQFVEWVRTRRGDRLSGSTEELFSGEVFTGVTGRQLGLIDELGTLRQVISRRFPTAEISVAEPRKNLLARLGIGGGAQSLLGGNHASTALLQAIDGLEQRAMWNRFGL